MEYLKPIDRPKYRGLDAVVEPVRNYLSLFENGPPPERVKEETPQEKRERLWRTEIMETRKIHNEEMKEWKPKENTNATHEAFKTLFVCRLSKDTNAKRLKRVFEEYGPIKNLCLIHDTKTGKSRNYAFIEYENIKDFKGKNIDPRKSQ